MASVFECGLGNVSAKSLEALVKETENVKGQEISALIET